MNQALEVLAKLGRNEFVSLDKLPAHIAAMIEAKDVQALSRELDLVQDVVCAFVPAEDDNENGEEKPEDNPEDKPNHEESAICA